MVSTRLPFTFLAVLFVYGATLSSGKTYEECVQDINSSCESHPNTTVCTTDGTVYVGLCNYQKATCEYAYRLHKPLIVNGTGYGGICTTFIHHVTRGVHTTRTPKPLSVAEMKLFKAIADGIDKPLVITRSAGTEVPEAIKIFSKQDHNHKTYTRNPNCWAHDVDLTCISPWNSQGHNRKAGTLLSPRHAVWARHYNIAVNSTLRFVDMSNNVVDRKIIKTQALPVPPTTKFLYGYDMVIGLLDQDVPSSISFAKVLPKNFTEIYGTNINHVLPVFSTDYEEKALVDDLRIMHGKMVSLVQPTVSYRRAYYESKIVGDSGNPSFFIIDNQLVFLFVFTFGGAGSGTSLQYHYDDVNNVMHHLGGGYSLTEINLSKYITDSEITSIFG